MLFNVIGYNNEVIGQVFADNIVEAWDEALKMYINVLDVRPVVQLGGSLPWAIEKSKEIYDMPISKEEKYLEWASLITDSYYKGLLTEQEKDEYLQWEFAW